MYITRTLEPVIATVDEQFPALLVTGPRQVGKTTFLQHLAKKDRTYVTLDDPVLADLARQEPKLFLERFKPPILIDEIQYAPELLPYIKMDIDKTHLPGRYWLTGSQQFQLMQGITESLAGRVGILNLLGLSQWEVKKLPKMAMPFLPTLAHLGKRQSKKATSLMDLYAAIWRGSFPAIVTNKKMDKDLFYSSYVQTYLQRDVSSLEKIGNQSVFSKFLKIVAARTGHLVNVANLANDAEISPNTAKSWLSILQTSGIIYLLELYHNNVTKRMIKAPKLYFLDTGLCTYLTQWSDPKTLEAGAMSGAILETFVVEEMIKFYWHNGLQAPLYYYRDKDKKEIDLLIYQNQTLYPIEIKKTASPTKEAIRHFPVLDKLKRRVGEGAVICLVDTVLPITETVHAVPVSFV